MFCCLLCSFACWLCESEVFVENGAEEWDIVEGGELRNNGVKMRGLGARKGID